MKTQSEISKWGIHYLNISTWEFTSYFFLALLLLTIDQHLITIKKSLCLLHFTVKKLPSSVNYTQTSKTRAIYMNVMYYLKITKVTKFGLYGIDTLNIITNKFLNYTIDRVQCTVFFIIFRMIIIIIDQ
jgi:hypothetical protein